MDLNKIELPSFTVAELYRSSLVIPAGHEIAGKPVPAKSTTSPKWLGNNQKNILVVVKHTEAVHLPDTDLDLLTGILKACKLSLDDVVIVNLTNFPSSGYKELTGQFKSSKVFLFGIDPANFGLPMNFPHFQSQNFSQVVYLNAPALEEVANNRDLKTALWTSLKKIFNL